MIIENKPESGFQLASSFSGLQSFFLESANWPHFLQMLHRVHDFSSTNFLASLRSFFDLQSVFAIDHLNASNLKSETSPTSD